MKVFRIKIVAVCGSIRAVSTNLSILRFIEKILPEKVDFAIYRGLAELPAFNPDFDAEDSDYENSEVVRWRKSLRAADGVIFCTPEYAHGVPGVLKNALDWVVSSGELVDKPTTLITASPSETGGEMAMAAMLPTIKVMSAKITANGVLKIPFVKRKINGNGDVTDADTLQDLNLLLESLVAGAEQFQLER